jgi:hypothetical protein
VGLEVAVCLTPPDLADIGATRFTTYRLKCQGKWKNTELGYIKLKFLKKYSFMLKQDRILKMYQLVRPFKVWIPTRYEQCILGKIIDPNVDLWFTGQEPTVLAQVFMVQRVTTGKVFLWTTSP